MAHPIPKQTARSLAESLGAEVAGACVKITPIKSDSLPRPRCSPSERADYDAACKLEGVNVNSNMRTLALNWITSVFKKHKGKEAKETLKVKK